MPLFQALESRLLKPGDLPEQQVQKAIIFSFLVLATVFQLFHGVFFWLAGSYRVSVANATGFLVPACCALAMASGRNHRTLWRFYTGFHVIVMTVINHLLGGLHNAQGTMIYVLFFPLVVYAADGPRAALVTLLAGCALYAGSWYAMPFAPTDQIPSPLFLDLLGFSNMVGTTCVGLIAIFFYGRQSRSLSSQLIQEKEIRQQETLKLLENILPGQVAQELLTTGLTKPVRHDAVSILFTDFSGFTQAAAAMPADLMVSQLNEIFAKFDDICDACGIEKIKTIGDAYMAAAGVPDACEDHAERCIVAGLQMLQFIDERNATSAFKWGLRVGIHSGPVVAGVVGKRKYAFDVWGDTVNIASRMESHGVVGKVNVSAYTCHLVTNSYPCEHRGKVEVKGKGAIDMYLVIA